MTNELGLPCLRGLVETDYSPVANNLLEVGELGNERIRAAINVLKQLAPRVTVSFGKCSGNALDCEAFVRRAKKDYAKRGLVDLRTEVARE